MGEVVQEQRPFIDTIEHSPTIDAVSPDRDRRKSLKLDAYLHQSTKLVEEELLKLQLWNDKLMNTHGHIPKEELQPLIRLGIPEVYRGEAWKMSVGCVEEHHNRMLFDETFKIAFNGKAPSKIHHVPSFGGIISPSDHHLDENLHAILKRLLVMVAVEFPHIEYCPVIPDIAHILLTFVDEKDAFCILYKMISNDKYFPACYKTFSAFVAKFSTVVEMHHKHFYKHMNKLNINLDFIDSWFSRLFVSYLPYHTVLRVFDLLVSEGSTVLYKVALMILKQVRKALKATKTKTQFYNVLQAHLSSLGAEDCDLVQSALALDYKLKDKKNWSPESKTGELQHLRSGVVPFYVGPKIIHPSGIIENQEFEVLWSWLPVNLYNSDPVLVFSAVEHGFSVHTLFHKCSETSPAMVIIKTNHGSIFGAFISAPLKQNKGKPTYHGEGDSFVWSLKPHAHHWTWKHHNRLFVMNGNNYFCIGGGGSGHSLWINDDFEGRSTACETFDSPPLEPHGEFFHCVALEVYGLNVK